MHFRSIRSPLNFTNRRQDAVATTLLIQQEKGFSGTKSNFDGCNQDQSKVPWCSIFHTQCGLGLRLLCTSWRSSHLLDPPLSDQTLPQPRQLGFDSSLPLRCVLWGLMLPFFPETGPIWRTRSRAIWGAHKGFVFRSALVPHQWGKLRAAQMHKQRRNNSPQDMLWL